jgi:hypothetical protein
MEGYALRAFGAQDGSILRLSMTFSDLPSPAEAGFAKAGNRFTLFGIMLWPSACSRHPLEG